MKSAHIPVAACLVVVLAGCGAASGQPSRDALKTGPAPVTAEAGAAVPAPDAAIPTDPAKLAADLRSTTTDLYKAIDAWTAGSQQQPPQDVVLLSLHHQRIYRVLARNKILAARTVAKLPKALKPEATTNVTAIGKLLSLARPITAAQRAKLRLAQAAPATKLRGYFVAAEKKFKVEWEVLAAIMLVETKFGRVRSASSTGAQGPMQFMPGTWKQYGMGGDVRNTRDAVLGAANYLKASGAPGDYRKAVWAYNHDNRYVDAVLGHARQIKRDPRSFYAYYNWQVYVLSAKGDVRMTGPR